MTDFIRKYSAVWGDDPRALLEQYNYHPNLTEKLDALQADKFDRETLYEIVLWKLSRYPYLDASLVDDLRSIAGLAPGEHREAADLVRRLLRSPGIALPMASTILRFLNPRVFQIIDDRAYRVLLPASRKYRPKPARLNERYVESSAELYFQYLDELRAVCSDRLPFESADRILYQLDIQLGNAIGYRGEA